MLYLYLIQILYQMWLYVSIIIYCLFKGHTHPRPNEERNIVLRLRVFDIPGNVVIKQSSFQTIRIKHKIHYADYQYSILCPPWFDMIFPDALWQQVISKYRIQKVRFIGSPDSGDVFCLFRLFSSLFLRTGKTYETSQESCLWDHIKTMLYQENKYRSRQRICFDVVRPISWRNINFDSRTTAWYS